MSPYPGACNPLRACHPPALPRPDGRPADEDLVRHEPAQVPGRLSGDVHRPARVPRLRRRLRRGASLRLPGRLRPRNATGTGSADASARAARGWSTGGSEQEGVGVRQMVCPTRGSEEEDGLERATRNGWSRCRHQEASWPCLTPLLNGPLSRALEPLFCISNPDLSDQNPRTKWPVRLRVFLEQNVTRVGDDRKARCGEAAAEGQETHGLQGQYKELDSETEG